ncbi:MAG TPA: peptidylprolyl isomerase [Pseudonocardiaceae bacterium]
MPTNEQRRQAAKRKLERQLANRAARAKRRRILAVASSVVLVLLVVGGIYWLASGDDEQTPAADSTETTPTAPPAETTEGACKYTSTPAEPAAKPVELPDDPAEKAATGTVSVLLKTNNGDIPITLDRAKAPCTVQSIVHLMASKFYDDTPCHRLVSSDNFKVLQCGDPTGQGTGGPGYTIPDEKPTDLAAAPPEAQGASVYPRGAIAMANTGAPNSGGSQFFLVYGTTFLAPDYTVFGTISEIGLATLDKIGAEGVDPASDQSGRGDGKPKLATTITEAQVLQ